MKFQNQQILQIFQNFSKINSNLAIFPGNSINTISDSYGIAAFFSHPELNFEREAGIYDLSQFLSILSLFKNPTISQNENHFLIFDENEKTTKFFYASLSSLKYLQKDIIFPETDIKFLISKEQFQTLKKAANTLNFSTLVFSSEEDGSIVASVMDIDDPTSNVFSIKLLEKSQSNFRAIYEIKNLQMIDANWTIEFSKKKISRWTLTDNSLNLTYIVALHKGSTFE